MKFSNGGWLNKEGYTIACPEEVYSARIEAGALWLFAPCKKIAHRGMAMNGPVITYRISAPRENIIRVQAFHNMGQEDRPPSFTLYTEDVTPEISIGDLEIRFRSGDVSLVLDRREGKTEHYLGDFHMAFYEKGRFLTASESRGFAYITGPDKTAYMREELSLSVGETAYGLGERFTPFVKNGQSLDSWNRDGGTSTEQSYKCIPFYLTNRGYGVLVNHPEKVEFEIASEKVGKAQFSVAGEKLDYLVIGGGSMSGVLQNYTALTGRPPCPPAWSFGLWLTTSFVTDYDEPTVNHFIDGMAQREIPLQVFHFDSFWMRAFQWTDFLWDSDVFPDPPGMIKRLHDKGLRICVWINPYISQQSVMFEEGKQQGYLLKRPNGDIWQWDLWQPSMAIVDFTNPGACDWYAQKLTALLAMGVDTFKSDFGERIPTDVVYHSGADPQKMHNYYAYLFNELVYNTVRAYHGEKEALVFARSSTVGGQQFPVHWGGDNAGNFPSMAESLRGGLSLSLSGFGFWSHDIGGFESTSTPDVYKRWTAFGLLSSHSRLHGSHSYRVPWLYDEEAVDVLRFFTTLKCRLMPALYAAAVETSQTGLPFMRPMVLTFPEDPVCAYLDRQYMLCGGQLLVSPVFNPEGQGHCYLPAGRFTHLLSGKTYEGGRFYEEVYDYFSLPLFVRPNTLLPVGSREDTAVYDYDRDVVIHVYEPEKATATVCDPDGNPRLRVSVVRDATDLAVTYTGRHPFSLFFHGLALSCEAGGEDCEITRTGTRLWVRNPAEGTIQCRISTVLPQSGGVLL